MNQLIKSLLEDKIEEYTDLSKRYCDSYNCYCWDEDIRHHLIGLLKIRSEYKRTLKEYKKQCDAIRNQKYKEQFEIWRKHPDKFIEKMFKVNPNKHQIRE